jgi:RimJ/RimL family protein N-acetyltransferase
LNAGVAERVLLPRRTRRLEIRPFRRADVTALVAYRNAPDVWRYQDWTVPYTRDLAHSLVDDMEGITGPMPDAWVQLALDDGTGLVGDLAVWLAGDGELAMIGYTIAPHAQGRGYATEAAGALVDLLLDEIGVHRVAATLDPSNNASARVLERLGFRYEGRSVSAAPVRGSWEDDDRYAILAEDRAAWTARPLHAPTDIGLVEVTPEILRPVERLATHHWQEQFVAPVVHSFADAAVPEIVDGAPVVPWFRAVRADGELVAFVMLALRTDAHPDPFLWRLLVDRWHQGRGIGSRTLRLVGSELARQGEARLATSWVDAPGGPAPFYLGLGFEPTGEIVDHEVVAVVGLERLLRG